MEFRIPTAQFRSLPNPSGGKVGFFFAPAGRIPKDLQDWKDVNPRDVKETTAVYKAILQTLNEDPERFAERNRGLTISADRVDYEDKRREVVIHLTDKEIHGVLDGGHTLRAVVNSQAEKQGEPWPAEVFLKVITGVQADQIAEIAGGLNTSQQVDVRSIVNLQDHFEDLKKSLEGQPYADKIAYKMNSPAPIDVREILYYLAVFDCASYDDEKHPSALFGRKEGIVRKFAEEAASRKTGSFGILVTKAPEILDLRDRIEKAVLSRISGRFKAGNKERVRSPKNVTHTLHFLNEKAKGRISLGWLMPMLGGFRANVDWNSPKGTFSWKISNTKLLDDCIEGLVGGIIEIHQRENSRPEYVGRNATAWRMCYERVRNAILTKQLEAANAKAKR